ncbi:hypothetical protein [Parasitella parasitica]|uniref:DASH complex subunit ASK1 n=1 Tax=Parasitella parasitica TaxID=35722 RepID=A0A0B7N1P2_9FUNG|nr:hypothetical protein [Parasitella parasitica]
MSEEEADAELERLQQKITRNLQEIDKNFAEGNRLINSVLVPNIERYAEATARIWNHCKIWLYFFESLDKTGGLAVHEGHTNRPPHRHLTTDSTGGSSWNPLMNHDVTLENITDLNAINRLRRSLQRPPSTASPDSDSLNFLRPPHAHLRKPSTTDSVSTSSLTDSSSNRPMMSPPRTMPFGIPSSSLAGTPIREAARILTDNVLETAGIRGSDDDSFEFKPGSSNEDDQARRLPENTDAQAGKAWDETDIMEVDDEESRARFNRFFEQRQSRVLDLDEELPTWGYVANSPSNRNTRFQAPLASTPTTSRVREDIMAAERNQEQEQSENDGAYEFSDPMPHDKLEEYQAKERQSMSGSDLTFRSGSNMTTVSGSTGQIPAKFDLQYFPPSFRIPPASAQLTRIYNCFAERPGSMLTIENVLLHLSDISADNISLLIELLVRKKFLKKVGKNDAWTVRR